MRSRGSAGLRGGVTIVAGAVGGVGTSTLAALLSRQWAAEGRRVVLVDLALARGGIEVLLGLERADGARWPDLAGVRGTLAPGDLDGLLPRWAGVEVLSATRAGAGSRDGRRGAGAGGVDLQAVAAVWRGLVESGRIVVADVPMGVAPPGDPSGTVPGLPPEGSGGGYPWSVVGGPGACDVLVVTGQDVLGVAGAAAVRDVVGPDARLVLRRRPSARVAPAEAAGALDLRLAGLVPTDRGVAGATDRGLGPLVPSWSPLARAVRGIARSGP